MRLFLTAINTPPTIPCRWDWLAISLNPYYEGNDQFAMIDDDVLIGQSLDHWCVLVWVAV